jgi:hypothetical protein
MTSKSRILAIDLAKGRFQVCAVGPDGVVVFNRAMSPTRLAALLADHPACPASRDTGTQEHLRILQNNAAGYAAHDERGHSITMRNRVVVAPAHVGRSPLRSFAACAR